MKEAGIYAPIHQLQVEEENQERKTAVFADFLRDSFAVSWSWLGRGKTSLGGNAAGGHCYDWDAGDGLCLERHRWKRYFWEIVLMDTKTNKNSQRRFPLTCLLIHWCSLNWTLFTHSPLLPPHLNLLSRLSTLHTFLQRFCWQNNTFPFPLWNADPSAVPLTRIAFACRDWGCRGLRRAWRRIWYQFVNNFYPGWTSTSVVPTAKVLRYLQLASWWRIPTIVSLCVSLHSLMWRVQAGEFLFTL